MKPELNQTQAVYPPEDPKPKVCVTTTIEKFSCQREIPCIHVVKICEDPILHIGTT